jgi:hypothetical protein
MKTMMLRGTTGRTAVTAAIVLGLMGAAVLAHKANTSTSIAYDANTVPAGTIVTITGTTMYTGTFGGGSASGHVLPLPVNGDPVVGDTVQIQQLQLASLPVGCGTVGASFVSLVPAAAGATDGSGQFSTTFDTTGLLPGNYGFRVNHPDGGGAHGAAQSASACLDLVVAPSACTGGVIVDADLAAGPGEPVAGTNNNWSFRITVQNCTGVDLEDVKVQGGTSGWTTFGSAVPTEATSLLVQTKKKTSVVTWTLDLDDQETQSILVNTNGTAGPTCPATQFLSGAWSAAYKNGVPLKSEYTGRISVDTVCAP